MINHNYYKIKFNPITEEYAQLGEDLSLSSGSNYIVKENSILILNFAADSYTFLSYWAEVNENNCEKWNEFKLAVLEYKHTIFEPNNKE